MRVAAALLVLIPAGCGITEPAGADAIDRETFVRVYVELRQAARVATDSADFAARRRKILSRGEVTSKDLREFIDRHAGQVGYLGALWETINARIMAAKEDSASG